MFWYRTRSYFTEPWDPLQAHVSQNIYGRDADYHSYYTAELMLTQSVQSIFLITLLHLKRETTGGSVRYSCGQIVDSDGVGEVKDMDNRLRSMQWMRYQIRRYHAKASKAL